MKFEIVLVVTITLAIILNNAGTNSAQEAATPAKPESKTSPELATPAEPESKTSPEEATPAEPEAEESPDAATPDTPESEKSTEAVAVAKPESAKSLEADVELEGSAPKETKKRLEEAIDAAINAAKEQAAEAAKVDPTLKENPVAAKAILKTIDRETPIEITKCINLCKVDAEECTQKCIKENLPQNPEEQKKFLEQGKEDTKSSFCVAGCQSLNTCSGLASEDDQWKCSMGCLKFCDGTDSHEEDIQQ